MVRHKSLNAFLKRLYATDMAQLKKDFVIKKKFVVEKFQQKAVRVAVLGACTPTGEALSLFLKTNPLVSHLYLHGDASRGVAADLSHIDTRTMVSGFYENDVDKAVRRAEIVVILPACRTSESVSDIESKFRSEYQRLIRISRTCTMYCPKALIYVAVPPVSMAVALVTAVFKKSHWYHPGKIIGSVAFHQIRMNTIYAFNNNLDPSGVNVPLVGGSEIDTIVPLFSRATPIGCECGQEEPLTKRFRNIPDFEPVTLIKKKIEFSDLSPLSHGYAMSRAITTIALGMLGDQNANMTGFIRSNILATSRFLATTIRIGPSGVYHNFGIPVLTEMELELLEQSLLLLDEREKLACKLYEQVDEKNLAIKTN